MITYEKLLDEDLNWALHEAGRYFAGKSRVHQTLRELAPCLDELGIEYAVIGALAMFFHGYRRFTQDVDILVTPAGLATIDRYLLDQGYSRPSDWIRGIRDIETGVAIHISVAGMPSDSLTYPFAVLPGPEKIVLDHGSIKILNLSTLLEMKIALGRRPASLRHLADAQAMIQVLDLPLEYSANLSPVFHDEYATLWNYAQIAKADDY